MSGASGASPERAHEAFAAYMRELGPTQYVWGVGVVFDVLCLALVWPRASWAWVLGCRAVGFPLQPLVVQLARRGSVSPLAFARITVAHSVVLVALMAAQALALGGLESPYVFGVLTWILAAPLVVSFTVRQFLVYVGCWALAWLVVMVAGAWGFAEVAAQWRSARSVTLLIGSWVFMLGLGALWMTVVSRIASLQHQLEVARKVSRYRLKARLGEGGMSEVWLAWDERDRRDVALKLLRGEASATAARRFEREARAMRMLESPHTVRVYDFGASDDGVLFLAMERLEGYDLQRLVALYGPLPPGRAIVVARQMCASLAEAHDKGIVHRDIKPSNAILMRGVGRTDLVKVLDFGIAQRAGDHTELTADGAVVGTPHYLAPEALTGAGADARTDVFSLAATVYFLLTGTRIFEGLSGLALFAALSMQPIERPSLRVKSVIPLALEAVVMRGLAKDPRDRYARAEDFEAALAACADEAPWTAADMDRWWRSHDPSRAVGEDPGSAPRSESETLREV